MTTDSFKALLTTPGFFEKIEICAGAILKTSNNHSMPKKISTALDNEILILLNATTERLIKHGGDVGEREWGHDPLTAPGYVFSKKEGDVLVSVLKQSSSKYKHEDVSIDKEMFASYALSEAIRLISLYYRHRNQGSNSLDLLGALRFAVDALPDEINPESEAFNFCIGLIQDAMGQSFGDAAGVFFSGDEFFEEWKDLGKAKRFEALVSYCRYELAELNW